MSVIIFQHSCVNPERGGINRMSKVYFDILSEKGFDVWFLSIKDNALPQLPKQIIIKGDNREERKESFLDIMKQFHAKVLIYQDGISPYNNYILRWAKEANIKIIDVIHSTLRGMYGIDGHSFLSGIKPFFLKKVVNRAVNSYFKLKYARYYREQFKLCDKVILLSDKFRNEITTFTGWDDFTKFHSISNPLPLSPHLSSMPKKNIVLHVGTLSASKRQDLLMNIWKKVEKRMPNWDLVILGDGRKRHDLEKLSQKLKLCRVHFMGFQNPETYYQEASLFCLTSAFESFGLVLVESMAYGCVPIAFNSFETACDIIDNEMNGLLIPPFDINLYSERMISLMQEKGKREEMSARAIIKSKVFNINVIGKQWIRLVESLGVYPHN